jgi:DNA modification methylase
MSPTTDQSLDVRVGDCRQLMREMPDESVQCCVTSPPYWGLRDYGHPGQIGQEETPDAFVQAMVEVFREVRRVLKKDGTCWLNLGDTYAQHKGGTTIPAQTVAGGVRGRGGEKERRGQKDGYNASRDPLAHGLKHKELIGIPWRVAFALQADGWYLRQDIIWAKPNPMPESVTDRCTKSHEYIFLLTKSDRYFYDHEAIKEGAVCGWNDSELQTGKTAEHQLGRAQKVRPSKPKGSFNGKTEAMADTGQNAFRAVTDTRNKRSVWNVALKPYSGAHFATYPPDLIKPCIMAGTKPGDVVLDPFGGSGTTGQVALELGRRAILCELNPDYAEIIHQRTNVTMGLAL